MTGASRDALWLTAGRAGGGRWQIRVAGDELGAYAKFVYLRGGAASPPERFTLAELPSVIDVLVRRGDVDAAKAAGAVMLELIGIRHGVRGLEATPSPTSRMIGLITIERLRQVQAEGWSAEHDDGHDDGELARAAACYALSASAASGYEATIAELWPWSPDWFKPGSTIRELEKSGALVVAELERLERKAIAAGGRR